MSSIFKRKETLNIECKKTIEEEVFLLAKMQRSAFEPIYQTHKDSASPYLRGPEDFRNKVGQEQRHLSYTIYCDGMAAGYILIRLKGSIPFMVSMESNECYLQRIFIEPKLQRKGIASEAFNQVANILKLIGKETIYVDFPVDLPANKLFFESIGFVDTNRTEEVERGLVHSLYVKHFCPTI